MPARASMVKNVSTIRDELKAIRERLLELHGEFGAWTPWLNVAAHELRDAIREIPRAELERPSKLLAEAAAPTLTGPVAPAAVEDPAADADTSGTQPAGKTGTAPPPPTETKVQDAGAPARRRPRRRRRARRAGARSASSLRRSRPAGASSRRTFAGSSRCARAA